MPKKASGTKPMPAPAAPMLPFSRDAIIVRAPRPTLPEVDIRNLPRKPGPKSR